LLKAKSDVPKSRGNPKKPIKSTSKCDSRDWTWSQNKIKWETTLF